MEEDWFIDEGYEARLRRSANRGRRVRLAILAVFGLVALAPLAAMGWRGYQSHRAREAAARAQLLDDRGTAELRELADALEQRTAAGEASWKTAMSPTAFSALDAGTTPCPRRLAAPTRDAADSYVKYASIDGNYFGGWGYRVVRPGQPVTSGELAGAHTLIDHARAAIADGSGTRRLLAEVRSGLGGFEVVVVEEPGSVKPVAIGDSFTGGTFVGHAYLYDHARRAIACVAEVNAKSSDSVSIRWSEISPVDGNRERAAQAALGRDLEVQIRGAISAGLRTAVAR